MTITPSHIIQYLYCARFTYFEYVLRIPQYEERNYKVMRGRNMHERKSEENAEYLRKKIGVKKKYINQYLGGKSLRGEVDEVLLLGDGTMAPLDYKFAEYKDKVYSTYKTQLYCYAVLIEQNFGVKSNRGFLVYTRSRNKLIELTISARDKARITDAAEGIGQIIGKNIFPKATKIKKRCVSCTYKNICIK